MNDTLSNFRVTNRDSFIEFMELLQQDLIENPETWKNKRLLSFLKAFTSFSGDMQDYYDNMRQPVNADEANWKTFADIFKAATLYE